MREDRLNWFSFIQSSVAIPVSRMALSSDEVEERGGRKNIKSPFGIETECAWSGSKKVRRMRTLEVMVVVVIVILKGGW